MDSRQDCCAATQRLHTSSQFPHAYNRQNGMHLFAHCNEAHLATHNHI